jgi:hypothetical protein
MRAGRMLTAHQLVGGAPSQLYDALQSVLGLSPLTATKARLTAARKQLSESQRVVSEGRRDLREQFIEAEDERARRAAELLKASAPDPAALAQLLHGSDDADEIAALDRLRALSGPDPLAAASAAERIRAAVDRVGSAASAAIIAWRAWADAGRTAEPAALAHALDTAMGVSGMDGRPEKSEIGRASAFVVGFGCVSRVAATVGTIEPVVLDDLACSTGTRG